MPAITEEDKLRRSRVVESVLGTNAMEGIEPDAATRQIFDRYICGDLTLDQFSAALDAHAMQIVAAHQALAGVA